MKKKYSSPEFDLFAFSFERLLQDATVGLNVSGNEHSGNDNNDSNEGDW